MRFLQEAAEELNKTIRCKNNENLELDKVVNELIVQVSERQNIDSTNGNHLLLSNIVNHYFQYKTVKKLIVLFNRFFSFS